MSFIEPVVGLKDSKYGQKAPVENMIDLLKGISESYSTK